MEEVKMQQFNGIEYIKIDIANQMGHDKLLWQERINWVDDNEHKLEKLENVADDRLLYIKAVRALRDAQNKVPTGFIMGLDATASGLQIMACLMGCEVTAANVNLINTGVREDIYSKVSNLMTSICGTSISRSMVKPPVMTVFYGSTQQPKLTFGDDTPELESFYTALDNIAPGGMECMRDIQGCWGGESLEHVWTLPDGHVAKVKVMVPVDKKVEIDELDHATFTHRVYVNEAQDRGLSLAANIIHSIDGYMVREMVRRAEAQGFELLTIHDSFWASPNYMNEVRQNYADILAYLADSSLLEDILNEITGQSGHLDKYTTTLSSKINSSEYALS